MQVHWSGKALSDLLRLHEFLAAVNKPAAERVVKALTAAVSGLVANPRIGEKVQEFEPDEVRRILVGQYEVRYQITGEVIHVVRLWHTREQR